MSEQPASAPRHRENVLTHKLGPLPTWAWIAVAAAAVLAYSLYKGRTSAAQGTSVPSDQVPQFVNQTFTTVTPPRITINEDSDDRTGARRHHPKPPRRRPGREEPGTRDVTTGKGRHKTELDTFLSAGRLSANQLARQWHEPVETILQTSASHSDSEALEAYIREHNWNKKIPAGVRLYVPED